MRRELRVDVAEVLVGGGGIGLDADRHLEVLARALVVAARRVQDGEVVVRLGQLGIVLGEGAEDRQRLVRAREFGQDHAAQEAAVGVLRPRGEVLVHERERRARIAGAQRGARGAQVVVLRVRRSGEHGEGERDDGRETHSGIYCGALLRR